ncbi:MAG: winged helix-turn-helix domain-containing protein, partial [Treponema sp.]|nr:winged helix-turn-helix domain-containing protein [Treponema sp.]
TEMRSKPRPDTRSENTPRRHPPKTPPENTPRKYPPKTSQKILDIIKKDPKISIRGIADLIGVSPATVKDQLNRMKDNNLIARDGPNRGGSWKIIE